MSDQRLDTTVVTAAAERGLAPQVADGSAAASAAPVGATPAPRRPRARGLAYDLAARGSLLIVLGVLVAVFTGINGGIFFSASNFRQILFAQAATGVLALAVTVALVAGEVDLSVAGVMGTVAAVVSLYLTDNVQPILAVFIGLALALAFGLLNGILVTYLRLSSIIATLATGTIATGVGLAIVGPDTISALPNSFDNAFSPSWGWIGSPFYMFALLIVVAAIVLQRTPLGRRLFFVGESKRSAELLGIRVRRLTIGAMVASGLLAGIAGLILAGQSDGANVTETSGYLLPAFAAAFLGTSAITPGRFNALGTFIAMYVLGAATIGLDEAGVANWTSYVFDGALLVISLGVFTLLRMRRERAAKARSMQEAFAVSAGAPLGERVEAPGAGAPQALDGRE